MLEEPVAATHSHPCIFCNAIFACTSAHEHTPRQLETGGGPGGNATHAGSRCCTRCRHANMQMLDAIEETRRRRLYR